MIIIRPTLYLSKKMNIKLHQNNNQSSSVLGDWLCNYVPIYGNHFILSVSSTTRLQVITKAAPYKSWTDRFIKDLKVILEDLYIPEDLILNELEHYREIHLAKSNNRSIMGTVNDAVKILKYESQATQYQERPIEIINFRINQIPIMVEKETNTLARTRIAFGLSKLDIGEYRLKLM